MLGGKGTLAQCISKEVFGDEDVELPIRCALILMQFKIWCNLWILSTVAIQYYKIQLIYQPWYLTSLQLYWKQSRTISSNSSRLDGISNIHISKLQRKLQLGVENSNYLCQSHKLSIFHYIISPEGKWKSICW